MVVDYRALNRATVRKVFIIPNSDQIKSSVAGSRYLSVGDAKEGFNQVENEHESAKEMAVLSVSGTWIPRGLTFGPTNGPEDFQELVFIVFSRRLYRERFLFLDDLCVATGRKPATPPGPSGAEDVWGKLDEIAASISSTASEDLRAYAQTKLSSSLLPSVMPPDLPLSVDPQAPSPLFNKVHRVLHESRTKLHDVSYSVSSANIVVMYLATSLCRIS